MAEDNNHELVVALARLTDQVGRIASDVTEIKGMQRDFATKPELQRLERQITELRESLEKHYTPLSRFSPVEKAVYSVVALIAMTVIGALLAQVVLAP